MTFKPTGYTSAAPYLIVDDAKSLIEFLAVVFGAERLRFYERDDGSVQHSEVRIDDTVVMIAESLEGWPATSSNVHVYVANVDSTFERALEAGAEPLQVPAQKGDPDKRGGVRKNGVNWWIATQIGDANNHL